MLTVVPAGKLKGLQAHSLLLVLVEIHKINTSLFS